MPVIKDLHQFLLNNYLETLIGNPGEFGDLNCRLCGSPFSVKRNQYGPTSWGGAMAQKFRLHDRHQCPNINSDWHVKARNMLREIHQTSSPTLAEFIKQDIIQIIKENTGFETKAFEIVK